MSKKIPRDHPEHGPKGHREIVRIDSPQEGGLVYHFSDGSTEEAAVPMTGAPAGGLWDRDQIPTGVSCPEGMVLVPEEPVKTPGDYHARAQDDVVAQIREWWLRTAQADARLAGEKYREYGATSLSDLGYGMAELMGWERPSKGQAQELAVYYFLMGKMARLKTAVSNGQRASEDTWTDIACYAMIARKARESGAWPTGDTEE